MNISVPIKIVEFVSLAQGYLYLQDYSSKVEIIGYSLLLKVSDQRYDMVVAINFGETVFSLPVYSPSRGISVDIFVIFF